MNDSTRRGFIAMAGAGAAVGITAAALPASASASPTSAAAPAEDTGLPADAAATLVAYVADASTGELVLMIDDHEEVVTDKALVARLARAFAKAKRG